jgi:hypothetical protein
MKFVLEDLSSPLFFGGPGPICGDDAIGKITITTTGNGGDERYT